MGDINMKWINQKKKIRKARGGLTRRQIKKVKKGEEEKQEN